MSKEFPSPNAQIPDDRADVGDHFVIWASSFFRHYDLVIRHSSKRHGQPSIFHLPSSILAGTIAVLCLAATVARADERDVQFNRWFAAQTNLQSWSADFTQTRSLKVLSQPLVATGKVWVTVPNRFRWELGQPAQTIVLRQPDQLLIIYPRLKRAEKYSLEGVPPGPLKDALALMDASLPRDRQPWKNAFVCSRRRKRTRFCK